MSCQLTLLANLQELRNVKKYLFPNLNEDAQSSDKFDGWDDSDWGWKDEEEEEKGKNEEEDTVDGNPMSWVTQCHMSLSPAAELMAVTNDERLVLLAQKWDSQAEDVQMKYSISFEGVIRQDPSEKVSCVLCLPLASQKRSTQGGPDWTCVIVGFSTGFVRFYTESGALLLSQIFSEEPVNKIKCRTYEPPRHIADSEKHEELNILYRKSLVTIDGFSLVQSLRACRNQVARATASGSEHMQPPPLAYKKWGLKEQDQVTDYMAVGMLTPDPFTQMQTASMIGGFSASVRPTPPACHLYMTTGVGPYTGFFYAIEGSAQPMLSDVAQAVASKLKSALYSQISAASGWFGFGGGKQAQDNHSDKKKPKIEPATSLPARFGLHDKRRQGESILLSPDNRLAATTDSFGRVMLIDILRGSAVRMWKGYRDAQVGWVEVQEDLSHDPHPSGEHNIARRAQFLVIYAPRRGILEVWASQQGPRVAAFNVSRKCFLLCPNYGLMGLNNVTYRDVKIPLHNIYILDPEGTIKTVEVPFHLALSDKNSKRARDMHLLKKLKIALKEYSGDSGNLQTEVITCLLDIKIASIRQQGLERVLQTKFLSTGFLQSVIRSVIQQLETQATKQEDMGVESLDYESKVLLQYCKTQEHLLGTYIKLKRLSQVEENFVDYIDEDLTKILSISGEEIKQLNADFEKYHQILGNIPHVRFQAETTMTVVEFLGCFECHMLRSEEEGHVSKLQLQLPAAISESKKVKLANFLFRNAIKFGTSSDYNDILKDSHITPENLMALLMNLWLSEDTVQLESVIPLRSLLKSISCLKDPASVTVDHNHDSPWWQSMRESCSNSDHISAALLAAFIGRSVAHEMGKTANHEAMMTSSTDSGAIDISDWESVTVDLHKWTLLVKQLEDLLALQCLLKLRPASEGLVSKPVWEPEPITVHVKRVLEGGRGVMPEFVAKWIAGQGIPPSILCYEPEPVGAIERRISTSSQREGEEAMEVDVDRRSVSSASVNPIIAQIQEVQKRLPHSLDADILMANCAWEYMVIWNKDPEVIFALEQAVEYLKCIQNAKLQHGLSTMIWQMFIVKKLSSSALLMEKVGKAPKDRLCRRDVGLSDKAIESFMGLAVDILENIIQAREDSQEVPVFQVEYLWQTIQGPTSLVELAAEQKETNLQLVEHHYYLCVILHAILTFGMKSCKPLSLFDTKGKNAFFKPLPSSPIVPNRVTDESILQARKSFVQRVVSHAVLSLSEKLVSSCPTSPMSSSPPLSSSPPSSLLGPLSVKTGSYGKWPPLMLKLAKELSVDVDDLRRHHVCELYSCAMDKMAEEVLLTVNDHAMMGSQLLMICGQRLAHFILVCDPADSVERLTKCSPTVSNWLKSLDPNQLRCPNPPLSETAALVGQVVNQLPEGHSEYNTAIELVELVQLIA